MELLAVVSRRNWLPDAFSNLAKKVSQSFFPLRKFESQVSKKAVKIIVASARNRTLFSFPFKNSCRHCCLPPFYLVQFCQHTAAETFLVILLATSRWYSCISPLNLVQTFQYLLPPQAFFELFSKLPIISHVCRIFILSKPVFVALPFAPRDMLWTDPASRTGHEPPPDSAHLLQLAHASGVLEQEKTVGASQASLDRVRRVWSSIRHAGALPPRSFSAYFLFSFLIMLVLSTHGAVKYHYTY